MSDRRRERGRRRSHSREDREDRKRAAGDRRRRSRSRSGERDSKYHRDSSGRRRKESESGRSKKDIPIEVWRYDGEGDRPLSRRPEFRTTEPPRDDFGGSHGGRGGYGSWRGGRGGFRGSFERPVASIDDTRREWGNKLDDWGSRGGRSFERMRGNFKINASGVQVKKSTGVLLSDRWADLPSLNSGADGQWEESKQRDTSSGYGSRQEGYGRSGDFYPRQQPSFSSRGEYGYGGRGGNRTFPDRQGNSNFGYNRGGFNTRGTRGNDRGRRGTVVYRPGEETEKPVMNLFDPASVPKGRSYFDHDDRSRENNPGRGGRGRGYSNRGDRYSSDNYGGRGGNDGYGGRSYGSDGNRGYGSDNFGNRGNRYPQGHRYSEAGYRDKEPQVSYPSRRPPSDGKWGHDMFEELQQNEQREGTINMLG